MKKCEECFSELQEFLLDRLVAMGLDAVSFLHKEREIERFLVEKLKEFRNGKTNPEQG